MRETMGAAAARLAWQVLIRGVLLLCYAWCTNGGGLLTDHVCANAYNAAWRVGTWCEDVLC